MPYSTFCDVCQGLKAHPKLTYWQTWFHCLNHSATLFFPFRPLCPWSRCRLSTHTTDIRGSVVSLRLCTCLEVSGVGSEGQVMRWRAKGKMAEMGKSTPLGLWGKKHTQSEGRFDAHPCWPGGTLETRRSENIRDLAGPFSAWTSV